jgi:hypothetical protein
LVALVDAAHVDAASLAVGSAYSAIRFLTSQDARVLWDTHEDEQTEPTMYWRLVTTVIPTASRQPSVLDGDGGDNEPMWLVDLASAWACLDVACRAHALAESEPLIMTALASPERSDGGSRRLRPRSPIKQRAYCSVPSWLVLARSYPFPRLSNEDHNDAPNKPLRVVRLLCDKGLLALEQLWKKLV